MAMAIEQNADRLTVSPSLSPFLGRTTHLSTLTGAISEQGAFVADVSAAVPVVTNGCGVLSTAIIVLTFSGDTALVHQRMESDCGRLTISGTLARER